MKNHTILGQIIFVFPLRTALYKSYANNREHNLTAQMILKKNPIIHAKNGCDARKLL